MRELGLQDRPREKLERTGAGSLGDNELLAVLVGHGTADMSALDMANRLLRMAGGLHGLTRLSRDEFAQVPGVGTALAGRVQAAIELGRRTLNRPPTDRPRFISPRECALFLLPQFGAFPVERFGVVLLDARHRVMRTMLLTVGATDASVVHPRDVFRTAALAGASAIIAFHNHPSGDATPSRDDVKLTQRLVDAGKLMGIAVLDHVILADADYISLREAKEAHITWHA